MANKILSRDYVSKPSESDARQQLPLTLLVAQLIDLATDHANELGIGYHFLEPRGLGWVLSRLSVEMKRWPKTGEHFTMSTWIESWNAHFSERCFSFVAKDGEVLGYARTVWVIIDLESHRSVGTAGEHVAESLIEGVKCSIPKQQRHRPFEPTAVAEYTFRYTDLDFYRHVNTVKYISLLLNQFSLQDFDSNLLSRFDIAFAHEAKYGESVTIKMIDEDVQTPSMLSEGLASFRRSFDLAVQDIPILTASIVLTKNSD